MKLTHASTFSGIGAPEIAAEMLGWDNLFHVEINPFGRQILEYYFPNSKSYEDITKSDFSEWRGKVDVLTGGFPCQPFSYAGKRRGSEDDRYLWPFMLKCIEQVQPRWFVGENVGGITTMVFPGEDVEVGEQASLFGEGDKIYEKRERYVIDEICESLERAGYSVQPMLIPACAVGAPHRRDRVFIVASRNNDKREQMARTATDANGGDNGCGRPTGHESEGEEKRISQRDEVRKSEQSAMLRHVMERDTANTTSQRRREIYEYVQSELADGEEPFGNGREWTSSYTYRIGQSASRLQDRCERQTLDGKCESESFNGIGRPRSELPSSDAESEQGDGHQSEQLEFSRSQSCQFGRGSSEMDYLLPENRWRTFPSVSPVYRGNDGFPFDVGDLTIPFGEWKRESLKAYGNAIVPQVMYEIFRGIDEIESNNKIYKPSKNSEL